MNRAVVGDVLSFDLCHLQKVGQIKNPGIMSCILIRCSCDKNLEMIQRVVQELYSTFSDFGFGPWWSNQLLMDDDDVRCHVIVLAPRR
jgi:hypothetical protein